MRKVKWQFDRLVKVEREKQKTEEMDTKIIMKAMKKVLKDRYQELKKYDKKKSEEIANDRIRGKDKEPWEILRNRAIAKTTTDLGPTGFEYLIRWVLKTTDRTELYGRPEGFNYPVTDIKEVVWEGGCAPRDRTDIDLEDKEVERWMAHDLIQKSAF